MLWLSHIFLYTGTVLALGTHPCQVYLGQLLGLVIANRIFAILLLRSRLLHRTKIVI